MSFSKRGKPRKVLEFAVRIQSGHGNEVAVSAFFVSLRSENSKFLQICNGIVEAAASKRRHSVATSVLDLFRRGSPAFECKTLAVEYEACGRFAGNDTANVLFFQVAAVRKNPCRKDVEKSMHHRI